jgi:xylulose-5-phosphate/fructose-6-phosphate phosphoketolase
MGRFHLIADLIDRVPKLGYHAAYAKQAILNELIKYRECSTFYGDNLALIQGWRWAES